MRRGSVPTKNARADLNLPNPLSDARLDRSNVEPGNEPVTAHMRAPQVHMARTARHDIPGGRIKFNPSCCLPNRAPLVERRARVACPGSVVWRTSLER